ncbi:glutaminase liver isoform, mitochondrial [Megalops cyprinoides]|uniref:glutaminase liver isoform, mitochondrial n=1 Tax=Megalops cyprinoides TaxID=118141 RepID=UPI001864951C|nr:glutaminase liver isoform, mitochondrial [Megalops cyprinoides]
MENSPSQDRSDEKSYLCFQRTPSLRRKWRKRYGGLDGNKLLEPEKEDDMRENGLMTESHQERNSSEAKSTESQETVEAVNIASPIPRNAFQSQKSVNFVTAGSPGSPLLVSSGSQRIAGPNGESGRNTNPYWHSINRLETQQNPGKRKLMPRVDTKQLQQKYRLMESVMQVLSFIRNHYQSYIYRAADVLFESFASDERISVMQFFEAVWSSGIQKSDPRIKDCYLLMKKLQEADGTVDRNTFHRCVTGMVSFILKALQGRFVIPDFSTFSEETQKLFLKSKHLSPTKELGSVSGNSGKWGVSICTVDGQRLCIGDSAEPCVLREISWPLIYGIAVDQLSVDYVHRHVGVEDFSKYESAFMLTKQGVPHSPLTETGAIITTSLLQLAARLGTEEDEKYESVLNVIRKLCNKEHASINCTSYQNLRKDSVGLHALAFYLQEKKCFPESIDINTTLDLLHQCSSTEVTCESGAAMAATLANGGLCPLSGDQVLSPSSTRSMLSMMQVAGMNDYSRTFHFKTSVPAKSSQSGGMLMVVPGVLGLMCWSPELDAFGNSWKSVHFCEELVSTFQLHSFEVRTPFRQVVAYRQWKAESEGYQIMNILLSAYRGDVQSLRRYFLSGADMNAVDYDGRSALHVAASEGHLEVIMFLIENAGVHFSANDRWGNTPLQEAVRNNRVQAVRLLKKYTNHPETV